MILFIYDKTLDGLLTALFDAYNRKTRPAFSSSVITVKMSS